MCLEIAEYSGSAGKWKKCALGGGRSAFYAVNGNCVVN